MKFSGGISNLVRPMELRSSVRWLPPRSTGSGLGLYNSIQSSPRPPVLHSLMTTFEAVAVRRGRALALPGVGLVRSSQSPFLSRPMEVFGT